VNQEKLAKSAQKIAASTRQILQIRVPDIAAQFTMPNITAQFRVPDITEQITIPSIPIRVDNIVKNIKETIDNIDWDQIKRFDGIWGFIEAYTDIGWSMPYQILVQIYDDAPNHRIERDKLEYYIMNKINNKQFFHPFKEYMVTTLEKENQTTFRDTLKLITEGYYVQSALHCFAVIESLLRDISMSDASSLWSKKLIKHTKSDLEELNVVDEEKLDLFVLHNMFSTIEKILLTELFANHKDKPTGISILRNELSHGMADESKISKTDCFKLLMIILTLTEVKNALKNAGRES